MELNLINENEIKISLTKEDLCNYDLTVDNFDYDNTRTRRAIWELFDRAKEKTGFDAATHKIYIQLYPCKNGGCELYVKKLIGSLVSLPNMKKYVWNFSDFDNFYFALQELKRIEYDGSINLYKNKSKSQFFIESSERLDLLYEFAGEAKNDFIDSYFKEHCKKIPLENIIGT